MRIILDEHKNVKVGDASFRTTETSVRLMKTLEEEKSCSAIRDKVLICKTVDIYLLLY